MTVNKKSVDVIGLIVSRLRQQAACRITELRQCQLVLADGAAVVSRTIANVSFLFELHRIIQMIIPTAPMSRPRQSK